MLYSHSRLVTSATLFIASVNAFSASSTNNLAVYWGQNSAGSQGTLASYCQDSTIDIIPISFLVAFGTGSYSLNFANMCGGPTIAGSTLIECDQIAADIKTCQAAGKKILLSMGGASGAYGFSSAAQAVQVANDMWNYFGGGSSSIRPFGTSTVDGFDLDIENNNPAYYPEFIAQLRSLYATQSAKTYYISGAPQCVYPDASLKDALANSWFDFLFIQFYNNYCGLYQYGSSSGAFNYNVWDTWANTVSANKNVKLYLGVAASVGAANAGTGYVAPSVMVQAAQALKSQYPASFGGIMMWDASQAYANVPSGYTINYAQIAKQALGGTIVASSVASSTTSTSSIKTTPAGNVATTQKPITTTTTPLATKPTTSTSAPASPVTGCTKTYTVASGDYCYAIWTKYGLSSDAFYALNPSLSTGNNCLIQPGQVLCVSNSGATQTPSTTKTTTTVLITSTSTTTTHISTKSTTSTSAAAAATAASKCAQTYTVVSGDYCYAIWTKYGLSSDAFYALNPSLSAATNCAIKPGQVLCVSNTAVAQTTSASKPATTTAAAAAVAATTAAATSGSTCPVSGGACAEGSYQCNGYGYAQCVFGAWVLRACPSGTACAGSGSNIYCDWPGTAAVTCSGIAGKTNSKRSIADEDIVETLVSEVKTSMSSHRLNATHFVLTLKAKATGIAPIGNDWYFTFQSEKDILESDRGVLYRDALDGSYTVSADPLSDEPPTRSLSIRLTGTYERLVTVQEHHRLW